MRRSGARKCDLRSFAIFTTLSRKEKSSSSGPFFRTVKSRPCQQRHFALRHARTSVRASRPLDASRWPWAPLPGMPPPACPPRARPRQVRARARARPMRPRRLLFPRRLPSASGLPMPRARSRPGARRPPSGATSSRPSRRRARARPRRRTSLRARPATSPGWWTGPSARRRASSCPPLRSARTETDGPRAVR